MRIRTLSWTLAGALSLAILGAIAISPAETTTPLPGDPAESAIRATLHTYMAGHAQGRGEAMASAFTAEARLSAVVDGQLRIMDVQDYLVGFPGAPAADETDRRRWIQSVDVVGDMAVARVVLLYPAVRFVDYMVLHRVEDDWKIVHKAYHAERR
jgi:hypothetical protein